MHGTIHQHYNKVLCRNVCQIITWRLHLDPYNKCDNNGYSLKVIDLILTYYELKTASCNSYFSRTRNNHSTGYDKMILILDVNRPFWNTFINSKSQVYYLNIGFKLSSYHAVRQTGLVPLGKMSTSFTHFCPVIE